ncbi:MAG: hypothetical protein Q8L29_02790 [archaeon]|nr:hypothetical protein [archaeon]
MDKSKTFGIRRLKKELNSQAFLSGLEAITNFTSESWMEAGFDAYYSSEADTIIYPDYITIGDERSVGHSIDFDLPEDAPSILKAKEKENVERRMTTRFEYPKSENHRIRREKGFSTKESQGLIFVHTHPEGTLFPSGADLELLNQKRHLFNYWDGQNYGDRNPIFVIAANNKNKIFYPLFIFQESSRIPLPENTDFEALSNRLEEENLENYSLAFYDLDGKSVTKEYNISYANFTPAHSSCGQNVILLDCRHKLLPLVRRNLQNEKG